nr:MAG TPA: hypothetical protein [Caudoviricetes sp.]
MSRHRDDYYQNGGLEKSRPLIFRKIFRSYNERSDLYVL